MTARFHPASSPDFVPAPQLRELQSQRLRAVVRRVYDRTELYRKRLDEAGLRPECIEGIDDIVRLPFTVKTDLRDTYPFGLFASPMDEIVRLHASSGTTGKPIVVAYTATTSTSGPKSSSGPWSPSACTKATSCRTPTATGCSPAAWGCTTAASGWGRP